VSVNDRSFEVGLTIPLQPEFVGVVRLAVARVGSLMSFSYDEVEDIRLAVGEACTHAIDRLGDQEKQGHLLQLRCLGSSDRLAIEVQSPLVPGPAAAGPALPEAELGSMLVRILMDELTEEERPEEGLHILRMAKNLGASGELAATA
jgi:serine/threonine-protein kinase RsbW